MILKVAEPKTKAWYYTTSQLLHDTNQTYLINTSSQMPTQGIADSQRIGDRINNVGWKCKLMFTQKSDRPNCNWRVSFVRVAKGSGYSYSQWYTQTGQTSNIMLDDFNNDFVKVVKDVRFKYDTAYGTIAGGVAREMTFFKNYFIPDKRVYKFGPGDGANTHNQDDLWLLVACYDAQGTLITDNIGAVAPYFEQSYRDP